MPVVSNVLNAGIGDARFAPMSVVYIYGSFKQALARDYTITVGGRPGYVSAVNSTGYLTAVMPPDAPLGTQQLVVTYQGAASAPYNVTLNQYAPEFMTTSVVPVTDEGPQFPLASYVPVAHSTLSAINAGSPAAPGERVISIVSGVGLTSPPIRLGGINSFSSLAIQPTVTVAGIDAKVTKAGSSGPNVEVDFTIPDSAPVGFDEVVLTIGGVRSNVVILPVAGRPTVSAVLNGANFKSPGTVAPGSIVSLFGVGFGLKDNLLAFPSINVNGTSVMFGSTPAPIFALAATQGQINALVPYDLPTSGTVDLMVTTPTGNSSVLTLNLAPSVPAMFFYTDPRLSTRRNAVALLPNSVWVAMPPGMGETMGLPTECGGINKFSPCAQPARVGDVIQLFVTGLGKATPNGDPNGKTLTGTNVAPASGNPLYKTVDTPIVTIGGLPAAVQFSGIAPGFSGLYQINVQIPAGIETGDDVPVRMEMPGSTADTATIAVRP
jgi:uncharacterized protein (TIGR03437 family)